MSLQSIFEPFRDPEMQSVIRKWLIGNAVLLISLFCWLRLGDWFGEIVSIAVIAMCSICGIGTMFLFHLKAKLKRRLIEIDQPDAIAFAHKMYQDESKQKFFYELPGGIHVEYALDLAILCFLICTGHPWVAGIKMVGTFVSFPFVWDVTFLKTPVARFNSLKTEE